jgi:hypothetical protein
MHKAASLEQSRFKDKDAIELKKRKYPPSFEKTVDMKKIQFDVIKKWLATRVTELNSGQEDETLVDYIINLLEAKPLDPKKIQIAITAWLGKNATRLIEELWDLLLDAQENGGIPKILMESKKAELQKRLDENARIQQELQVSAKRDASSGATAAASGAPNAWDMLDDGPQEPKKERDDKDSGRRDDRRGDRDDRRDNKRDSLERRDDRRGDDRRDNRDRRDDRDRDGRRGDDRRDTRDRDRRDDRDRDRRDDNRNRDVDRRDDRNRDDRRDSNRRDVDRRDDRRPEIKKEERSRDERRPDDKREMRKESPPRNELKRRKSSSSSSSGEDNGKDSEKNVWKEKKRRLDEDSKEEEALESEAELRKKLEESMK